MIIIGLGNPGKKYDNTPHNIGFEVIDKFAKENNFPDFKLSKKFKAHISKKQNIILAKPETFMNNSGKSVKKLSETRSLARDRVSEELVVLQDDIDLELGKIRVSKNRGSAGHKGIESIIQELGTKNFTRIRIGVKPPCYHALVHGSKGYVLKRFDKKSKEIIKKSIDKALEELKKNSLQ